MDSEKSIEKLKYKMTLLGDTAVGKTSLFKKLTKEEFDPKIVSTIGIDKKTLNFNIIIQSSLINIVILPKGKKKLKYHCMILLVKKNLDQYQFLILEIQKDY